MEYDELNNCKILSTEIKRGLRACATPNNIILINATFFFNHEGTRNFGDFRLLKFG